jgi:hypothetical protein
MPEVTRWPGWRFATIEEIDEIIAKWKVVPADARSALAAWVVLCTPLAEPLVTDRSDRAKRLLSAADCMEDTIGSTYGRAYLLDQADYFAMPLDLRLDVMPARWDQSILQFGWREPREGDLSQIDAMIVLGTELLIECGVDTFSNGDATSVSEIVAQAMDLFVPSTRGEPRASAGITRARARALPRWRHHDLKGRMRELLLNFRKYPPGELGAFVQLERWNLWTPEEGWHDSDLRREASRRVTAPALRSSP